MPYSAYFTAVTAEVTPGQDTSPCSIIVPGPRSGHARRASAAADELCQEEEHGHHREGAKANLTQRAPDKRRCSSAFCAALKCGQRLHFTAVPASNKRNPPISILNCIAKLLIN